MRQLADPVDGQLRVGDGVLLRNGLNALDQLQVAREILRLESGEQVSEIILRQVLDALELAREEAAAERRIGDDGDFEFRTSGRDAVVEDMVFPQRDLDLDSRDFVDLGGSPDRARADFTERDAADFTLLDELGECFDRVFDRGVWINPRALVQIEFLVAGENPEAIVHRSSYSLGRTIGRPIGAESAFDAQDHLVCVSGIFGEVVA